MILCNLVRRWCILSFDSVSLSSVAVDALGIYYMRGTFIPGIQQINGFENVCVQSSLSIGDTVMGKTDRVPALKQTSVKWRHRQLNNLSSKEQGPIRWSWRSTGVRVHRLEQMLLGPHFTFPWPTSDFSCSCGGKFHMSSVPPQVHLAPLRFSASGIP